MTFPKPRNALDGQLAPWTNWRYPCDAKHQGDDCKIHFCEDGKNCAGACPVSAHSGAAGELNASNGQSCYWFSNGCTIGCDECDGTQNHVGHGAQRFLYKGMSGKTMRAKNITIDNPWSPPVGELKMDASSMKHLDVRPNCERPSTNATICDPELRTANTQAACGSAEDIYLWSPWRHPGSAPVIDACGSAGGRFPGQGIGGAGAQYQNNSLASQGDAGSKLPRMPSQATWRVGDAVEVGWTVMANHGGGYAYRLAPANAPLTEATFRKMPLDFVGPSALRWDGKRSTQLEFVGTRVSSGTVPAGSMWSKNPIPAGLWERMGATFEPICTESAECKALMNTNQYEDPKMRAGACRCSGFSNGGPLLPNLEVVDRVAIPSSLPPGPYVLQWRWDCEESDQVWASCADVTVVA